MDMYARDYIKTAEQALQQERYQDAFGDYYRAHCLYPYAIKTPPDLSAEARKEMVDAYISWNSGIVSVERTDYFVPYEVLVRLGISQEDLSAGYLRALNLKRYNFRVSFTAATTLAISGNPAGKEVLLIGLKGEYQIYQIQDRLHFRRDQYKELIRQAESSRTPLYISHKISVPDLQKHIFVLAAFSLAELGERAALEPLMSIVADTKNYTPQMRAYATNYLNRLEKKMQR